MNKKKDIAAAISYNKDTNQAPVVLAKGEGYVARKIKEVGEESDIPTYEDEKLARQLNHLSIGEEIPPKLYEVVAEVLSFVIDLDNKEKK